jgi:STE24 endopeptidase
MNEDRATRYQRLRRRGRAAALLAGVSALALVALTPVARLVADALSVLGSGLSPATGAAIAAAAFAALLVVWWQLASLPARLYLGLRVDGLYVAGAETSQDALIAGQLRATALGVPIGVAAALVIQLSVWAGGAFWWMLATVAVAAGIAAALNAVPRAMRRWAHARPLEQGPLAESLTAMAQRAGVPVREVCVFDESADRPGAAVVSGTGVSRRVYISASVLRDWSDAEIAVVVAHELGHHAHDDLRRAALVDVAVLAFAFGAAALAVRVLGPALALRGAADPAALPLVALVSGLAWVAATPARHALSRRQERRADAFALALTGRPDAFDTAIRRLSQRHLAEERPAALTRWLYHRHPPVAERLAYARAAGASRDVAPAGRARAS